MAESKSFTFKDDLTSLLGWSPNWTNAQFGVVGSGLSGIGSVLSGFLGQESSAKAQKAYQKYSNTMVDLSNATAQDAITLNEIQYIDMSAQQAKGIQTSAMAAQGTLAATAAAAGVRGNSVAVSANRITGNAMSAELNRQREFKYAMLGFDQQRVNSAMAAAMQKDYTMYSGGSGFGSTMAGLQSVATMIGAF